MHERASQAAPVMASERLLQVTGSQTVSRKIGVCDIRARKKSEKKIRSVGAVIRVAFGNFKFRKLETVVREKKEKEAV